MYIEFLNVLYQANLPVRTYLFQFLESCRLYLSWLNSCSPNFNLAELTKLWWHPDGWITFYSCPNTGQWRAITPRLCVQFTHLEKLSVGHNFFLFLGDIEHTIRVDSQELNHCASFQSATTSGGTACVHYQRGRVPGQRAQRVTVCQLDTVRVLRTTDQWAACNRARRRRARCAPWGWWRRRWRAGPRAAGLTSRSLPARCTNSRSAGDQNDFEMAKDTWDWRTEVF